MRLLAYPGRLFMPSPVRHRRDVSMNQLALNQDKSPAVDAHRQFRATLEHEIFKVYKQDLDVFSSSNKTHARQNAPSHLKSGSATVVPASDHGTPTLSPAPSLHIGCVYGRMRGGHGAVNTKRGSGVAAKLKAIHGLCLATRSSPSCGISIRPPTRGAILLGTRRVTLCAW